MSVGHRFDWCVRSMLPSPSVPDLAQRRVVEHRGGPLLVLAGPGTGKTTMLVEAVVDRVERDGMDPEQVLVLTFSRRAAGELRQRIAARLGRTVREPLARTFTPTPSASSAARPCCAVNRRRGCSPRPSRTC